MESIEINDQQQSSGFFISLFYEINLRENNVTLGTKKTVIFCGAPQVHIEFGETFLFTASSAIFSILCQHVITK